MKDRSKTYGANFAGSTAATVIAAVVMLGSPAGPAHADEPAGETAAPALVAPVSSPVEGAAPTTPEPAATVGTPTVAPAGHAPPPVAPATPAEPAPSSWFARPPLTLSVGEGERQFRLTFYGFAEIDYIYDTTRSYNDAMGSALVARSDTYDGNHSRSQFSMRNSRLGFAFESPLVDGVKPSAVLEADFFGHQDSPPETSEATYFDSPTFRVRHAYIKLQSRFVDVLFGQTYDLFGWQNFSGPCSLQFLGLPNQLFSRNPQLRLSHAFNADGPLSVDVAVAAGRPAQRDSQIPDGHAGVRFNLNRWKGITTPGNVGTTALPASIGFSGIVRSFDVNAFSPAPMRETNRATGWGLAVDALLPLVPAASDGDRANRLTLTGSFVHGTGIADLITSGGGARFPPLQNAQQAIPAPIYEANIDPALVTYDQHAKLHTINWTAFRVGLQYYLPPSGRFLFSANYTQSHSTNLWKLFPRGGAPAELLSLIADTSRYGDANLFWDATPSLRIGVSGQYTEVEYLDGQKPHNLRGMAQTVYVF